MTDNVYDFETQHVLFADVEFAKGLGMFKGIMFKSKEDFDQALLFDFGKVSILENSIHSLFCIPFDAIFLDEKRRVKQILFSVKPWQFYITPNWPYRYLIETPEGWGKQVQVGQKLWW